MIFILEMYIRKIVFSAASKILREPENEFEIVCQAASGGANHHLYLDPNTKIKERREREKNNSNRIILCCTINHSTKHSYEATMRRIFVVGLKYPKTLIKY